jgi:phosphonate degradation associated HDIG domain protein
MPLTLDAIATLFATRGHRLYAGEPVTQLEHALQTAHLAHEAGAGATLVTAALLHDLGHLLNDLGDTPTLRGLDDHHEQVAIPRLRGRFPEAVLAPIRLHVKAKRYLCARGNGTLTGPQYLGGLSADSVRSLRLQGGSFSALEADAFIAQPHAEDAVRLRQWDDQAKVAGLPTLGLDAFLQVAAGIASSNAERR